MSKKRRFKCGDGTYAHHYELPPPDGRERIPAVCTICDRRRTFPASIEGAAWDGYRWNRELTEPERLAFEQTGMWRRMQMEEAG